MQIVVLNLTSGGKGVPETQLLTAVRAINRQIQEDFHPYWSITGRLRLDPAPTMAVNPLTKPPSIRGDGVIYIIEAAEGLTQGLLGYHDRYNAGIPFGVVYTSVCEALGEPLSVALSHEVLELLADPDVNLLCKGAHPSPAENGRTVYHWVEVCDPVQTQRYEIDGVTVSNFVLPAYYSGAAGDGAARCDFLLAKGADGVVLQPFGVARGGYVGFYDPATGADDHYTVPGDEKAVERATTKERLTGPFRRNNRREREHPLSLRPAPAAATPRALGIFVRVRPRTGGADLRATASAAAKAVIGAGWSARPFWVGTSGNPGDFELVPVRDVPPPAALWDAVYALRAHPDVAVAEPLLEHMLALPGSAQASLSGSLDCTRGTHIAESEPKDWSLRMVKAPETWAMLGGQALGAGIVIGHPDTGYTRHPELQGRQAPGGYDFVSNDEDPTDPLESSGFFPTPGHGTGTSSVVVSGSSGLVTGVAPDATCMELRVSGSIVIFGMGNVAKAIRYAADKGCQVISMSLGGLGWDYLQDAVDYAISKGCIVLAAAGNCVYFVTHPAHYDEVIAVAACNARGQPWSGSSRGSLVDVTAPGESVWRAAANAGNHDDVGRGKGTSFAVATVAGIAALWLCKHGWDQLKKTYGDGNIQALFTKVLRDSAHEPDSWDKGHWGTGIVDAAAVLRWALPGPAAAPRGMAAARGRTPAEAGPLASAANLVAHLDPPRAAVRAALAAALGVSEAQLDARLAEVGQEAVFHLASDPAARDAFEAGVTLAAAAAPHGARVTDRAAGAATRAVLHRVGSKRLRRRLAP